MADRTQDWFRQSERDLEQAGESARAERHEWACFAAHQAAEKAIKALHLRKGQEVWGHVVRQLIEELPSGIPVPEDLADKARVLDAYYVPTRYPNGHPSGVPGDHYGNRQSKEAIELAGEIIEFVRSQMA